MQLAPQRTSLTAHTGAFTLKLLHIRDVVLNADHFQVSLLADDGSIVTREVPCILSGMGYKGAFSSRRRKPLPVLSALAVTWTSSCLASSRDEGKPGQVAVGFGLSGC
jgi:hypothetical protein